MSPMTYSGASWSSTTRQPLRSSRGARNRARASTSRQCCATEKICEPLVWPFQRATLAKPWAISSISMSRGEGSSKSSLRPDSMRCQARGASVLRACGLDFFRSLSDSLGKFFGKFLHGLVAVAGDDVIIDHADGLHEGVDDGRPTKFEAALREILGHRTRGRRFRRNLACGLEIIDLGFAVD